MTTPTPPPDELLSRYTTAELVTELARRHRTLVLAYTVEDEDGPSYRMSGTGALLEQLGMAQRITVQVNRAIDHMERERKDPT